jgi:hypothetical protein
MMNVNPVLFVILGIAGSSTAQIFLKSGSSFDILSKNGSFFISKHVNLWNLLPVLSRLTILRDNQIGPIMMVVLFNYCGLWS